VCGLRKNGRMPTGSGAVHRYLWLFRREKAGGFGVTGRRMPAINCQASNKQKNLMRKHGVFLLSAV
ncbi:hypothetical protein, partial [Raoultella terrigena]|uniref:hypothetical protein n=1 Tax=Raoultella terrigena TaxID=577 RepID=UPI001F3D13D3